MELTIKSGPVVLEMKVVDIEEDHLPSFRSSITLNFAHPSGKIVYLADDIWFECHDWDDFEVSLQKIGKGAIGQAQLKDMSCYFNFSTEYDGKSYSLVINVKEPDTGGGELTASYKGVIDADALSKILTQIQAFPGWWK